MRLAKTVKFFLLLFSISLFALSLQGATPEEELVELVKQVTNDDTGAKPSEDLKIWVTDNRAASFAIVVDTLWHQFSDGVDFTVKREEHHAGFGAELAAAATGTKPYNYPNEWFDFLKFIPGHSGVETLVGFVNKKMHRDSFKFNTTSWARFAALSGLVNLLKVARLFDANLEYVDEDGRTIVHDAASVGKYKILEYLEECGVVASRVNKMDSDGLTPLDTLSTVGLRPRRVEDMKKAVAFLVARGATIHKEYYDQLRGYWALGDVLSLSIPQPPRCN